MARLLAWIDAEHEPVLVDLLEACDAELVGVSCADERDAAALGSSLGLTATLDLRAAIEEHDPEVIWLASGAALDRATQRAIGEGGCLTITSEPRPASLDELQREADGASVIFAPLLRRSPGLLAARDVLASFGPPRCVSVLARCRSGTGSLFARLFDAMDLVHAIAGPVERIDAALCATRATVPESLTALHGHLTMNLRLDERRGATIAASDDGGRWERRVVLLGENGCLTIDDDGFCWDRDGQTVDEHREPHTRSCGALLAAQLQRILEGRDAAEPPPDTARLLALCEAARLSCRTGEGESPARLLEVLSKV
ncbi:MAG: Gfo/Idh/MocA family oxidoreductase [Planctomycetota bacterium]|jgi:predicted dehydrogenase